MIRILSLSILLALTACGGGDDPPVCVYEPERTVCAAPWCGINGCVPGGCTIVPAHEDCK